MTKQDWRDLAEARLIDADILLQNQRWAAAYYIAISHPQDGVMKWIRDHW